MNAKLLGIGALALACVAAAGTGAYVAVRQNASTEPATASEPAAVTTAPREATAGAVAPDPAQEPAMPAATASPAAPPTPVTPQAPARETARPEQKTAPPARAARVERTRPAVTPAPMPVSPAQNVDTAPMPAVVDVPAMPAPLTPVEEPQEPPTPQFEELVVPADAVVGLRVENSMSSETARVEDGVTARVTRDVRVGGRVAIPAGSRVQGSVVVVVRGGKFKERARLGVRFHTLITDEGAFPFQSEVVFREGDSRAGESAARVSAGAIGGAIIGAIVGGGRGAAIGTAAGAGAGTAAVAAGERSEAVLVAGSSVTVRLSQPVVVIVAR